MRILTQRLYKAFCILATIFMVASLASCAQDQGTLAKVSIASNPGTEPKIRIPEKMTFAASQSAVLQSGTGEPLEEGQTITLETQLYSVPGGSLVASSWDGSADSETLKFNSTALSEDMYNLLKGQNVGTTVAIADAEEDTNQVLFLATVTEAH